MKKYYVLIYISLLVSMVYSDTIIIRKPTLLTLFKKDLEKEVIIENVKYLGI